MFCLFPGNEKGEEDGIDGGVRGGIPAVETVSAQSSTTINSQRRR